MIEGELGGSLGSECVAVQLMGRDMQGCIPADCVVALLPFQHVLVAAAQVVVGDARQGAIFQGRIRTRWELLYEDVR